MISGGSLQVGVDDHDGIAGGFGQAGRSEPSAVRNCATGQAPARAHPRAGAPATDPGWRRGCRRRRRRSRNRPRELARGWPPADDGSRRLPLPRRGRGRPRTGGRGSRHRLVVASCVEEGFPSGPASNRLPARTRRELPVRGFDERRIFRVGLPWFDQGPPPGTALQRMSEPPRVSPERFGRRIIRESARRFNAATVRSGLVPSPPRSPAGGSPAPARRHGPSPPPAPRGTRPLGSGRSVPR